MSANLFTKIYNFYLRAPIQLAQKSYLSTFNRLPSELTAGGAWSLIAFRTNIRDNFPRAKEGKRVKIHGWNKRMSTTSGRRVLLRRILKGRHVLSH